MNIDEVKLSLIKSSKTFSLHHISIWLVASLFLFIVIPFGISQTDRERWQNITQVIRRHQSPESHLNLAKYLMNIGENREVIHRELTLSYQFIQNNARSVETHYPLSYEEFVERFDPRASLVNNIKLWNTITSEHTGYRDGFFLLCTLHYQLNEMEQAQTHCNKALMLDPNNATILAMERILSTR